MKTRAAVQATIAAMVMLSAGCGGGGGGGSSITAPPTGPTLSNLQITTAAILPGALANHPYTTTLTATGGNGALKWSIAPISPTTAFVDGLTIDPNTGVLSGTAVLFRISRIRRSISRYLELRTLQQRSTRACWLGVVTRVLT